MRHYQDGDRLEAGLTAVSVPDSKSTGETAFHQPSTGVLIVGDALIGKPAGRVSLLPAEKFSDPHRAREGVRRFLELSFEALLLGDGESSLQGGKQAGTQIQVGKPIQNSDHNE